MNLVWLVLIVLATACVCLADDAEVKEEAPAAPASNHRSLDDIMRFPVKTLRKMLTRKGLECKGCSEKLEFATKVFESQDVPDVAAQVGSNDIPPEVDQEKLDELMANLKRGGFGNSKMFSAADLKNMSPEEMSEKLGGNNKRKSKKGKKAKRARAKAEARSGGAKSSHSESAADSVDVEEDGHTIEL